MSFKAWASDTALRAVKTAAQTAVALLGVDQTAWLHADVKTILVTSGVAGVVSILHNVANLRVPGDAVVSEPIIVGNVERI